MIERGQAPKPLDVEEDVDRKKKKSRRRGFFLSWLRTRDSGGSHEVQKGETNESHGGLLALLRRQFERNVTFDAPENSARRSPAEEEPKSVTEQLPDAGQLVAEQSREPTIVTTEQAQRGLTSDEIIAPDQAAAEVSSVTPNVKAVSAAAEHTLIVPFEPEVPVLIARRSESHKAAASTALTSRPDVKQPSSPDGSVEQKESLTVLTKMKEVVDEHADRKNQSFESSRRVNVFERELDQEETASHPEKQTVNLKTPGKTESKAVPLLEVSSGNLRFEPEPRPLKLEPTKVESVAMAYPRQTLAEEIARRVEIYERQQEAPTAVLNEMVKAAEANAPVERIYERRQEVKDKSGGQTRVAPTLVAPASGSTPSSMTRLNTDNEPRSGTMVSGHQGSIHDPRLYMQAAHAGFWGAIMVLLLIFVIYLSMRGW